MPPIWSFTALPFIYGWVALEGRSSMIAIASRTRKTSGCRLKIDIFTLGKADPQSTTVNPPTPKPKPRSHRTTAFFEMP
jgi:hypothetical protein